MPDRPSAIGIKTFGLRKNFGAVKALRGLDMVFENGLIHGLIGPDGAGKTTLLRLIAGLLKPTEGRLEFSSGNGPVSFGDIRPALAYMPARPSLYPDLSIEEHLLFFKDLYSLDRDYYNRKSKHLLDITRLSKFTDRKAGALSGGMYKKLGLMCALLQEPSIMLLDEPTNGVDPISRRELWELLYTLGEDRIFVLVSTAYMDEAERCARVHLLDSGALIGEGRPADLLARHAAANFDQLFLKGAKI